MKLTESLLGSPRQCKSLQTSQFSSEHIGASERELEEAAAQKEKQRREKDGTLGFRY